MIRSFTYDPTQNPPAPMLELTLSKTPESEPRERVSVLVDSGSELTLLPLAALKTIGAPYIDTRYVRGISGHRFPVPLFAVTIHVGEHVVHGIEAGGVPDDASLQVGRDVLNALRLMLDGPAETVEVHA